VSFFCDIVLPVVTQKSWSRRKSLGHGLERQGLDLGLEKGLGDSTAGQNKLA